MKTNVLILTLLGIFLYSCSSKNTSVTVSNLENIRKSDSLTLATTNNNKIIANAPISKNNVDLRFSINSPVYAKLSQGDKAQTLLILEPGDQKYLKWNNKKPENPRFSSLSKEDSILNYFSQSTLTLINSNPDKTFSSKNPDTVVNFINKLIEKRSLLIQKNKKELSDYEYKFLETVNRNGFYSFLFHYGKYEGVPFQSDYFNFVENINPDNSINKYTPWNVLQKLNIPYKRKNDSIQSIKDFYAFIEDNVSNNNLEKIYLKTYFEEILTQSPKFPEHNQQVSLNSIKVLDKRFRNKFSEKPTPQLEHFYKTRKGVNAPNFQAVNLKKETVNLSVYKRKLVYIDVWATWCAPCLKQKPAMHQLIDTFQKHEDFAGLLVSVDDSLEIWQNYLEQKGEIESSNNLFIKDGIDRSFGEKYLISSIPRYILINKKGDIININAPKPGTDSIRNMIQKRLN